MGVYIGVYMRGYIYKSGDIFTNWLYNYIFYIVCNNKFVKKTKLNY